MACTLLVDGCYRDEDDCAVHRLPSVQPAEPGAAASGLSVVGSMAGLFPGRRVRPVSGHEAVADLMG